MRPPTRERHPVGTGGGLFNRLAGSITPKVTTEPAICVAACSAERCPWRCPTPGVLHHMPASWADMEALGLDPLTGEPLDDGAVCDESC